MLSILMKVMINNEKENYKISPINYTGLGFGYLKKKQIIKAGERHISINTPAYQQWFNTVPPFRKLSLAMLHP